MSDDLSQREKRLQRHKTESRKGLPKTVAKTYGLWLVALLVLGGAAYAIYVVATSGPDCPGHWHATFEVFVPGSNGQPEKVDMASPRSIPGNPASVPYYDLNGAAGMGLAVHMHQSANSMETGSQALGPTQWHFEQDGTCVGVKAALHATEMDVTATSLKLFGAHAQVHQDHTWTANATAHLHMYINHVSNRTFASNGVQLASAHWEWREVSPPSVFSYQLKDSEKLLVTFGDYPPSTIQQLEQGIPDPVSRAGVKVV